ncbi:MAG: TlpA family protein disulfide reductase [bacterium]
MRSIKRNFLITVLISIILVISFGCEDNTKARDSKESGAESANRDVLHKDIEKSLLKLPDFFLNDLEGKEYRLSDHVGEKPVLLVFWTTGCPVCISGIPNLNNIFLTRSKDLELISINILESKRTVSRLVDAKGIKYPVLLDPHGITAKNYRIRGVPTFIVIDLKGSMGYYGHDSSEAMRKIEALLS